MSLKRHSHLLKYSSCEDFTAGKPYEAGMSYCTAIISRAADDKFIWNVITF